MEANSWRDLGVGTGSEEGTWEINWGWLQPVGLQWTSHFVLVGRAADCVHRWGKTWWWTDFCAWLAHIRSQIAKLKSLQIYSLTIGSSATPGGSPPCSSLVFSNFNSHIRAGSWSLTMMGIETWCNPLPSFIKCWRVCKVGGFCSPHTGAFQQVNYYNCIFITFLCCIDIMLCIGI